VRLQPLAEISLLENTSPHYLVIVQDVATVGTLAATLNISVCSFLDVDTQALKDYRAAYVLLFVEN
jgi:hypothetical protein